MTTFENLTVDQKLRASLHRDIAAICKETCHCLGLDITGPAMAMIFEMFFEKLCFFAEELEAFSRHARRFIITGDDVRLLARRNTKLRTHLDSVAPATPATKAKETKEAKEAKNIKEAAKRRRTAPALTTPAKKAKEIGNSSIDLTDD